MEMTPSLEGLLIFKIGFIKHEKVPYVSKNNSTSSIITSNKRAEMMKPKNISSAVLTIEKLQGPHVSIARNPLLAHIFYQFYSIGNSMMTPATAIFAAISAPCRARSPNTPRLR
ncbi:MAG: hypothetical protein WBN66_07870 [Smithella sp.]